MDPIIHARVVERHPELSDDGVKKAWTQYVLGAVRVPGERELRIGYDDRGRLLEMVGVLTEEGWLVFHAMTPPSKKTEKEITRARRQS